MSLKTSTDKINGGILQQHEHYQLLNCLNWWNISTFIVDYTFKLFPIFAGVVMKMFWVLSSSCTELHCDWHSEQFIPAKHQLFNSHFNLSKYNIHAIWQLNYLSLINEDVHFFLGTQYWDWGVRTNCDKLPS